MNPPKYTEYNYIHFLITTSRYTVNNATATPAQNELSSSRLTLANDLWGMEKGHRHLRSQAASRLNAAYDNPESPISSFSLKERI